MKYDLTIHDIPKEEVPPGLLQLLDEEEIRYTLEPAQDAAKAYLRSCKGMARHASVDKIIEAFRIDPKNARAILGWSGSMANKFLRLAGVWDGLTQAERNVILGYEVATK